MVKVDALVLELGGDKDLNFVLNKFVSAFVLFPFILVNFFYIIFSPFNVLIFFKLSQTKSH